MLDNDTTRLDFLDLNVLPRHLLVHHATTALHPSVHQFTYLQVLYIYLVHRGTESRKWLNVFCLMKRSCCQVFKFSSRYLTLVLLQATHLFTLKMNVMLETPSVLLTIIRLDMTGASCRWSGLRCVQAYAISVLLDCVML